MYAGQLAPPPTPMLGAYEIGMITTSQQVGIRAVVSEFPQRLEQAKLDYYKFKAGLKAGLFKSTQNTKRVTSWFADFPRLWEAIRPNYLVQPGQTMSAHKEAVRRQADAFVAEIKNDAQVSQGLGSPLIIAGILVALAAGVAGILWAVGYIKDQNNITKIIDEVVAGRLPEEALIQAQKKAQGQGMLGDVTDILKWGAIAFAAFYLVPVVVNAFGGKKASA